MRGQERARAYDVAVVAKALDILEVLSSGEELGLSALSVRGGMSKASAFRILRTLEGRGCVEKDVVSQRYRPGPHLIALSCRFVSGLGLIQHARPVLEQLYCESKETVNLGVLDQGEVLYIDMLESHQGLRMTARVGGRDPLHSTALGKAILSRLPAQELKRLLSRFRWSRLTARTIMTPAALQRELSLVRQRGYAVDDEENEIGARCVGAPLRNPSGHSIGAISISGPVSRVSRGSIERIGTQLMLAAREIERRMGYWALEDTSTG